MYVGRSATLAASLATALLLTSCASDVGGDGGDPDGPIKVGVVLEVTGAAASIGESERDAINLAVEQVNEAGGIDGRDLEVQILDAQTKESQAAAHASTLVNDPQVIALIGSTRSGPSLAMRPAAEQAQVPMISLAAKEEIIDGSSWVFKTPPSDRPVVDQLVDYVADQGYETIGLLHDGSAFGEGIDDLIEESGEDLGVSLVASESFAPEATDFTAQLVNLRNADADVNVIWGSAAAPALATEGYRDLGIEAPLLQSYGVASSTFLQTAGESAEGVVLNANKLLVVDQLAADDPQLEVLTRFAADYEDEYGTPPSPFAGYAYDSINLLTAALRTGADDRAAVRDAIEGLDEFVGVTGVYRFSAEDHSGLGASPLVMLEVEDGRFRLLDDEGR